MKIRDRIKELRRVKASDLIPHPQNWRLHPERQINALGAILQEVGYADALLAFETPEGLMLYDGHARKDMDPDAVVPVLVTDLTEDEARKMLGWIDPLASLADVDSTILQELVDDFDFPSALDEHLTSLIQGSVEPEDDEWGAAFDGLPDGEKEPFQQMAFTLHDDQVEVVKRAMGKAKEIGLTNFPENKNGNGNALWGACLAFLNSHG